MDRKKLMRQYCVLQGCYWMLFATVYSFASVYLLARNFSNAQIGVVIALGNVCGVILQPVFASVADRYVKLTVHKLTALLALVMFFALLLLYVMPGGFYLVALLFAMIDALLQVMQPLVNSVSVYYTNRGIEVDFGVARGIGSVAFAVISAVMGVLIARLGDGVIMITGMLLVAVMGWQLCTMPVFKLQEDKKTQGNQAGRRKSGFIRRYPYVVIAAAGLTLLMMNHNMQNTYLIQIITPLGGDSAALGNTLAIAAVLELPTMFAFSRLVKRCSSERLLIISGIFFFAKGAAYLLCGNMLQMYAAQLLQMGAFALYIPSSVHYVNEVMEPQDKFKGQALMTGTSALGGVFGSLFGGALIDYMTVRHMMWVGTIGACIGMLTVLWSAPKAKQVR